LLRHLGERSPDTVPVVLTALADDDRLRDEIVRLGPRPDEILSKSGGLPGVAAALVLRLWRAELQIERRATLPLPELARLPYLRLRVRSRPDGAEEFVQMEVFGRVWHPTVRERQLLVLLARRPGRSVLQREIFDVLWPADDLALDDVDVSNALKVLVRRLRHRIMVEWLGLPDSAPARRAARQVLSNDGKDSYMLNARVDWEPVG
ncbi:MAG: winged helix-turn-helix domain-containing protein, partial [Planctomycetes bacterium]|nr:winged helix-turn-helix domain-containing protein [Planctomycetota bacterium]